MRHRLRLSLYDEYRVDAEVLDYLEGLPDAHRATFLQSLVRVGYQVLLKGVEAQAAYQQACLPDLKTQPPKAPARAAPAPQLPVSMPVASVAEVAIPTPVASPVLPAAASPQPETTPVAEISATAPDDPLSEGPAAAPEAILLFDQREEAAETMVLPPAQEPMDELLDADPAISLAPVEPLHDESLSPDPGVPAGGGALDALARMRALANRT